MIPGTRITVFQAPPDLQNSLKVLSREHEQILRSIERKESRMAAKLMRSYLSNRIRFAKAQTLNRKRLSAGRIVAVRCLTRSRRRAWPLQFPPYPREK